MSKKYLIGIDIGGTNTDIVLIDEFQRIVKAHKTATTSPLEMGVKNGLKVILHDSAVDKSSISGIFVGTTHATNAVVEQKNLYSVGLIRIAGHYPTSLRPCYGWPKELSKTIFAGYETIDGGFQCDLREISPFSRKKAKEAFLKLLDQGMESLAIIGVFSPLSYKHELACLDEIRMVAGEDFPISLSHEIGGIGFIERENATLLNGALKKAMEQGFRHLDEVKVACGLNCPLYITQNDGSLIGLQEAIRNPLLTISSGPTNSFIGAAKLAQVSDAIIVDVGGTTTDVGTIQNGFLRRSMHNANIGGISLNFRMPDVLSIGIGGGSYVTPKQEGGYKVGPKSCGKDLLSEALSFGGNSLTLTDIASLLGFYDFGNQYPISFSVSDANMIMHQITEKIQKGINLMKGKKEHLPVVFVGGGARIGSRTRDDLLEYASVANAFGAALAEFSGTIDKVVSLADRTKTVDQLRTEAMELSVKKGADPKHVKVVDVQILPYHYIPGQLARVIVTASGKRISNSR